MSDLPILFSAPMVRAILREIEQPGTGKTQTRRVIDIPGIENVLEFAPVATDQRGRRVYEMKDAGGQFVTRPVGKNFVEYHFWPKYAVGDRLYVREAHYRFGHWEPVEGIRTKTGRQKWQFVEDRSDVLFEAPAVVRKGMHHEDPRTPAWHVRQGRTMFGHHSRITLIVTDVRVQRLQEISETDAIAEGAPLDPSHRDCTQDGSNPHMVAVNAWTRISPVAWYHRLWDSLNADRGCGWEANPWVAAYTFRPILGNVDRCAYEQSISL